MSVVSYGGYQGDVEYSDGRLLIRILHIDDLISAECSSATKVESTFRDLVDDYLETCRAIGKEPEKPFKGSFNVRVGPETHKQAAMAAARQAVTLNAWVASAIRGNLEADQGREYEMLNYFISDIWGQRLVSTESEIQKWYEVPNYESKRNLNVWKKREKYLIASTKSP